MRFASALGPYSKFCAFSSCESKVDVPVLLQINLISFYASGEICFKSGSSIKSSNLISVFFALASAIFLSIFSCHACTSIDWMYCLVGCSYIWASAGLNCKAFTLIDGFETTGWGAGLSGRVKASDCIFSPPGIIELNGLFMKDDSLSFVAIKSGDFRLSWFCLATGAGCLLRFARLFLSFLVFAF